MLKSYTVTVSGLEHKVVGSDRYAVVKFIAKRADVAFEIPIPVDVEAFDEADYIRVARGLLHFMISDLAEELQVWALSGEDRKTIGLPDQHASATLAKPEAG